MTNKELIAYYKNLLILQYERLPKLNKYLEALLSQLIIYELVETVMDSFNLETATGDRLTKLGNLIGVDRKVEAILSKKYFGLGSIHKDKSTEELDILVGFASYYEKSPPGQMWTFNSSYQFRYNLLSDSEYSKFIEMRIAINTGGYSLRNSEQLVMKNSLKDLDDYFRHFFGGLISVEEDLENPMNLTYYVEGKALSNFFRYMIQKNLYPRPAGVGTKSGVGFTPYNPPVFAYIDGDVPDDEIPANILGYQPGDRPPIGVFALGEFREGDGYAEIGER